MSLLQYSNITEMLELSLEILLEKKGRGGEELQCNCVWIKTVDSKTAGAKKIRGRGGLQNYMSKTTGEKKSYARKQQTLKKYGRDRGTIERGETTGKH